MDATCEYNLPFTKQEANTSSLTPGLCEILIVLRLIIKELVQLANR